MPDAPNWPIMDSSRSLVRTCCSTPENVANWVANFSDSVGFSGSWFSICTVSILRNVSKSELMTASGVSVPGAAARAVSGGVCVISMVVVL